MNSSHVLPEAGPGCKPCRADLARKWLLPSVLPFMTEQVLPGLHLLFAKPALELWLLMTPHVNSKIRSRLTNVPTFGALQLLLANSMLLPLVCLHLTLW